MCLTLKSISLGLTSRATVDFERIADANVCISKTQQFNWWAAGTRLMSRMIAIHQRTHDVLCKTPLVLSGGEYETQEIAKYSISKYTNGQNVLQMTESCVQVHFVGNQIILGAVHGECHHTAHRGWAGGQAWPDGFVKGRCWLTDLISFYDSDFPSGLGAGCGCAYLGFSKAFDTFPQHSSGDTDCSRLEWVHCSLS